MYVAGYKRKRLDNDLVVDADITISGSGKFSDGTAGAPSITFEGDQNTGIYHTAVTDTIGFSTGGSNRRSISTSNETFNLPQLGGDGTATAPTYSFSGDSNTGMYHTVTADVIGFSSGGTKILHIAPTEVEATVPVRIPDGSAGTPALAFDAATSTGIYSAGTNILGISAGGSGVLLASSTSVTSTLPVRGPDSATASAPAFAFGTDTNTGIYNVADNTLGISAGGTLRASFSSAGVVASVPITTSSTTDSSSVSTGSIITSGGVGIAKKLFVGDAVEAPSITLAGGSILSKYTHTTTWSPITGSTTYTNITGTPTVADTFVTNIGKICIAGFKITGLSVTTGGGALTKIMTMDLPVSSATNTTPILGQIQSQNTGAITTVDVGITTDQTSSNATQFATAHHATFTGAVVISIFLTYLTA